MFVDSEIIQFSARDFQKMRFQSIFKSKTSMTSWKSILRNVKYSIFSDTAKFVAMLDSSWSQSTLYLPTTTTATTTTDIDIDQEDSIMAETMAIEEALRSKRMSFDPGYMSSSILLLDDHDDEEKDDDRDDDDNGGFCYQECEMLAVETKDPYEDFRVSMEEMVEAYELKECDWEYLEELLACYLRVNNKENHGFIVGAFIDMFLGILSSSSSSSKSSCCCGFSGNVYASSSKEDELCWCKRKCLNNHT